MVASLNNLAKLFLKIKKKDSVVEHPWVLCPEPENERKIVDETFVKRTERAQR